MTTTDILDGPSEVSTGKVLIRKLKDGLLENVMLEGIELDVETALEAKEHNIRLAEGKPYVVLVNSEMMVTITKDARELIASKDFAEHAKAKALLVKSLGHLMLARFYLKMNKPHMHTKVFTDRQAALEWLELKIEETHG